MKKIFTILIMSLFSLTVLAYDGTRLSISTVINLKLKVEIDGRKYNMNDNILSVRDLSTGYHTIKIYREKRKIPDGLEAGRNKSTAVQSILKKAIILILLSIALEKLWLMNAG